MVNAAIILPLHCADMDGLPQRIRERVKELQARGVTQSQIAERGGFTQGALQNWMSGTRKMPRNLVALARALESSVRWLMTGEDAPSTAYTETQVIAEILEGLDKLPLSWFEKAEIFQKAYAVGVTRVSAEGSSRGGNARLLSPPDTSS